MAGETGDLTLVKSEEGKEGENSLGSVDKSINDVGDDFKRFEDILEKEEQIEEEKKEKEEVKSEEEKIEGEVEVKVKDSVDSIDSTKEELELLKQITREQKQAIANLSAKLEEQNRKLEEAQIITPEDLEKQRELQEIADARRETLEDLLEVMRVNPKFEDIDEVVSTNHFTDLVEALTSVVVRQESGKGNTVNRDTVYSQIEAEIWAMRNPYKWCYEQIKINHPDYKNKKEEKEKEIKTAGKTAEDLLKVEKTATSILNMGGGHESTTWTKQRIDDLPEDELNTVPTDIYKVYMQGQLK